jgi:hypothetical protein
MIAGPIPKILTGKHEIMKDTKKAVGFLSLPSLPVFHDFMFSG